MQLGIGMDRQTNANKEPMRQAAPNAQAKALPAEGAAKFEPWIAQVRKAGLAAYARENLPAFRMEPPKAGARESGTEILLSWVEKNPKLLGEFEKDWARGNLVTAPWGKLSQSENPQKFDSALSMWVGVRYAFSEYMKKDIRKVPERVEAKWGAEFEKSANISIGSQRRGGELGPAAAISLNSEKGGQNAGLSEIVNPLERKYENKANSGENRDAMKKSAVDTEFFSQYLMRMNSISSPEAKAKISRIFLRLGALMKDTPELAFADFVGTFVSEINEEFGRNIATFRKTPVRADRDGMRKAGAFVPKKISGGGGPGKPPSA